MSTNTNDTRPQLTKRWRELEHRGWQFLIVRTDVDLTGAAVTETKRLIGVHPQLVPSITADVHVPMLTSWERKLLDWYEDNTPR